jgi:hypothetical protein
MKVNTYCLLRLDKLGCILEVELVAFLQLAVVLVILLYCVVGQVDERLVNATRVVRKCIRRCADVSFFEEVTAVINSN